MAFIKRFLKASQGGFTMIELVMVVILMALLAAVAAPYLQGGASALTVQAFARKVADDVRYAQSLALQRSGLDTPPAANPYFLYRIGFNTASPFCPGASQYNISNDADNNGAWGENPNGSGLTESAREPASGSESFCVSLESGDYQGYTVSADFGGSAPGILAFDQSGVPYDSDGARLTATRTITISKDGQTSTIVITPFTGLTLLQ